MNQCDGCRAGIPVDANGHHRMGGMKSDYPNLQGCTKHLYKDTDEKPRHEEGEGRQIEGERPVPAREEESG